MQGLDQSVGLGLSESDKKKLIERIVKTFYTAPEPSSGEDFVRNLKTIYKNDPTMLQSLEDVKVEGRDEPYGIITLIVSDHPLDLEFRLKKSDSYGGPKTENYLERIDLRIAAAKKWVEIHPTMTPAKKIDKLKYLDSLSSYFNEKIKNECYLDPSILKNLDRHDVQAKKHFSSKHALAKNYLSAFNEMLLSEINIDGKKASRIKKELYIIEQELMSKKRPERVSARPIQLDEKRYTEITILTPVDKTRTISSAKKDSAGVANWLKSDTQIYSSDFKLLDSRKSYRSASIIPHEIINKGITKEGRRFSNDLAKETAKRNLLEHVIPELVREQTKKINANQEPLPEVIELNFEMLTLLSPISPLIDKLVDPDFAQFDSIRQAFYQYDDRTFNVKVDERSFKVKFNGIYHNYGANSARGYSVQESKTNKKAFNQILEKSIETLSQSKDPKIQELKNNFFKGIPHFNEFEKKIISKNKSKLDRIYIDIEKNNQALSQKDHEDLLSLHAKRLHDFPLSKLEAQEYSRLKALFQNIQTKNLPLMAQANLLQEEILEKHLALYQRRQEFFISHAAKRENMLRAIEDDSNYLGNSEEYRHNIDHLRSLHEYCKLSIIGYDSRLKRIFPISCEKKNERNYAIQSYIAKLNTFNNTLFHKTCKSGKDRTNSAEEKEKAKNMISLHKGRIPRREDSTNTRAQERALFDQGYLHGPGNDICGDNMKPGAQQVSQNDIPSSINIASVKKISSLQKGLDKLKKVSVKDKEKIVNDFKSYVKEQRIRKQQDPNSERASFIPSTQHQAITTSTQEILRDKENNLDLLIDHLENNYKKNQHDLERPVIKWINNDSTDKTIHVKLKKPPPKGTKFFANEDISKKSLIYSVSKNEKIKDSALDQICRIAVNVASENTEFDLSITPSKSREFVYQSLNKYINEKFQGDQKPKIIGYMDKTAQRAKI